jgi:hypothetical protein
MRHWAFWEWVAYGCLLVAALIMAAETGFKTEPDVMAHLPSFFESQLWGFSPAALVVFATLILILREFVFAHTKNSYVSNAASQATESHIAHRLYAKQGILSPAQEKLLSILAKHQRSFAATKLIIGRDGRLNFDDDPSRGKDEDFVTELYGHNGAAERDKFIDLMESMPIEYIRFFPEMSWDSPFVISVTEHGTNYLRDSIK